MANLSKDLLVTLCVLLLESSSAAQQAEEAPGGVLHEVAATPIAEVLVDGRLEEWAGRVVSIRLGRAGQVWSQRQAPETAVWGGEEDLSAEVWIGYDPQHLYVAGRVWDDSIVRGSRDRSWHQQDAVEIFLDPRPDRSEPLEEPVQLFVMPFSMERPWGVVDWRRDRPSGASLIGVRAASQLVGDGGGYTFELVYPVANFGSYRPVSQIGFDLAIDDHDEGTERYQYMTATGRNPTHQAELSCALVFDGDFVPGIVGGGGDGATVISSWLQTNAWFLLLALVAIAGMFLLLRGWGALERAAPRLRPVGRIGGIVLFALGLLLPGFLTEWRHERHVAELDDVVTHLTSHLPGMAEGVLGSYGGEERDAALATLLDGGQIAREQRYSYTSLADATDDAESVPRPVDLNYAVRPYGIDLDVDSVERFEFREPIPAGNLNVTVARPRLPFAGREPPSLLVTTFGVDGSIGSQERLVCSGTYYGVPEVARPDHEVSFRTLAVEQELRAVTISEPTGDGLRLVGLTWASADGTRERALSLGERSLGGVVSDLRRGHPARAGFAIAPGGTHSVEFPARPDELAYDRLWMFYHGTYLGRPNVERPGDTVCELRVWERDRREARLFEFRHQESMFFELEFQNQEIPADADVAIGMRWLDDGQQSRVTMVRQVDLRANLDRLEFRNLGGYPIRFRALVFGREVKSVGVSRPDSPLERVPGTGEERLRDEVREHLGDAKIAVYRGGRMTATTLEPARRAAHSNLPVDVRRAPLTVNTLQRTPAAESDGGVAEYRGFASLAGGGAGEWGGAVLGVFLEDPGAARYSKSVHRIGTVLSLLALPILLHAFSHLLALLRSLRLRLVTLFVTMLLLPLGVVSFLLADVLEDGHADDLQRRLGQAIEGVHEGVQLQGRELRAAATTWVQDLAAQVVATAESTAPDRDETTRSFRQLMLSQRPPGWDEAGGSLLFEFDPDPEAAPDSLSAIRAFVGPDELRAMSTPLRTEPGLYVAWSLPFLGVRSDVETPYGSCSLSVVRRLDQSFLRGLANDRGIVLCGLNGYPLDVFGGGPGAPTPDALLRHAVQPSVTAERAAVARAVLDGDGRPVVRVHSATPASDGGAWFAIYDVLEDLQDTPRALVGLVERYEGATLPLKIGRVPLRAFLVTAAIVLLGASLFLGWVMTTRITTPIARLESGARALSQGELDVHVDADDDRGQIGQLTHAFNQMATDLRGRIQDLRALNRGIRDLTSRLDLVEVMASAVAFYVRNTPADRVRILVIDRERDRVEVFGGEQRELIAGRPADVQSLLGTGGVLSARLGRQPGGVPADGELARRFAGHRSVVVLPLVIGARARGAVFLLFESEVPEEIHLELHATMAVQITAAIDNAWLYRHAVEDLHTGAYRPEFFRARVARTIANPAPANSAGDGSSGDGSTGDGASAAESGVAVVSLRLIDGEELAAAQGSAAHGRLLEQLLAEMRVEFGPDTEFCREGDTELRAMLRWRGEIRASLESNARSLRSRVAAGRFDLPAPFVELRVVTAIARYPEDAASAEFLFQELDERLARAVAGDRAGGAITADQAESDHLTSPAMDAVYRVLDRVAPTDITLLIEGETGVGKEVLTDRIHSMSKRAAGPLVKVHCAALPESLLQSELFGHEKGAFTGAHERVIGRFEQADSGTIFLDEIGEISLDVQVQLLRVLQEREIQRVGSGRKISVDVRVIAATNRDMSQMVAEGRFREDLYYRLQGMVVVVPSLRDRRAEIPGLVEAFRREAVAAGDARVVGFSPAMMDDLFRRDWPGNIRELRNVVFRAMILAGDGVVGRSDLVGARATAAELARSDRSALDPAPAGFAARVAAKGSGPDEESAAVTNRVPAAPGARGWEASAPPTLSGVRPNMDRLAKLRTLVASRGSISSTEYATFAGLSPRTALRDLNRLQERGVLTREGSRRGARYRLSNPPSAGS